MQLLQRGYLLDGAGEGRMVGVEDGIKPGKFPRTFAGRCLQPRPTSACHCERANAQRHQFTTAHLLFELTTSGKTRC